MKLFSGLLSGILFGVGLAASGMTDTAKVIGFLDLFGRWDPDLMYVMGAAVVTAFIGFKLVLRRSSPLFEPHFHLPTNTDIDLQLLSGAALFGIGWGLYGYCPGPALAALTYLQPVTFLFVAAMVAGMFIADRILKAL